MNALSTEKRVRAVASLVEGNSIRATVRMTGVSKNAIQRLMTLRVTPAMEAGIADDVWTLEGVVGLVPESVQNAA